MKKKSLILHNNKAETEEFKRPNHPDFMTSSELKALEWSGVRQEKITGATEFWIGGEIVKLVTSEDIKINPKAIQLAHAELFGLYPENE